jgi:hypothetical protein
VRHAMLHPNRPKISMWLAPPEHDEMTRIIGVVVDDEHPSICEKQVGGGQLLSLRPVRFLSDTDC